VGDLLEGAGASRAGAARGRRGRDERRRGCGRAQVETGAAPASAWSPIVSKPLIPAAINASLNAPAEAGAQCVGGVIISVHTCRDESLTKTLSRSAPRLTGRTRVEALVACGAHQIHTQGKCTREVGGRRAAEGASVSVRACRCLCREEGAHAQFSCKKVAALNHTSSVAT
jgi:hypothetical protein